MHLALSIAAGIVLGVYTLVWVERWRERRAYRIWMAAMYPPPPPAPRQPLISGISFDWPQLRNLTAASAASAVLVYGILGLLAYSVMP